MGVMSLLYGIVVYLIFLGTFLYAIGFVGDVAVPKTVDSGDHGPLSVAVTLDVLLLGLFAVQHSVMARPAFKRVWTRLVSRSIERTTYVLFASGVLVLLYWQWRPIPQILWQVEHPAAELALQAIFWAGWALVLLSTFLINHFELFGLQQVFARLLGLPSPLPVFKTPFLYKRVRHPIYLGFLLAFWATPTMTLGHLLFAAATTGYILVGIWLEERDLVAVFGDQYRQYRKQVSMLIPFPRKKADLQARMRP
ncbi:methanethiol S-methyltransferase [Bradyrhizobium commune]|nr:methanethiol S-methyltransferase [Bradyrhizobium commune]